MIWTILWQLVRPAPGHAPAVRAKHAPHAGPARRGACGPGRQTCRKAAACHPARRPPGAPGDCRLAAARLVAPQAPAHALNPAKTDRSSAGVCSGERWAAQELADGRARRPGGFQAAPRRARLPAGAHRRRSCAPQRPCTPRWCLRTPRLPAQQRRPSAKAASRGLPAKGAQGSLGNRQRSALRGGALERPTPGLLHGCRLCPLGRRHRVPRVRGRVPRGARGRAADARNLRAVPPRVRGPLR